MPWAVCVSDRTGRKTLPATPQASSDPMRSTARPTTPVAMNASSNGCCSTSLNWTTTKLP